MIEDNTSNTNSFDIGSAIAQQITLKLDNLDGKYSEHDFSGARIVAKVGLEVNGGIEWLNKGIFYAEPGTDTGDAVSVKGFDKMTKFDQPYSISNLPYPATLGAIVRDACSCCEVSLAADSAAFENDDFVVDMRPEDTSITFRQILQWVGQITCRYCKINADEKLTLKWYDMTLLESGSTSGVVNVSELGNGSTFSTDDVVITGVRVVEEIPEKKEPAGDTEDPQPLAEEPEDEKTYQYGSDGYVLRIERNKLIQGGRGSQVATFVGTRLNGIQFRPMTVYWQGDPAIESGDIGVVTDRKGKQYRTIFTGVTYTARARQKLVCGAETPMRLSSRRFSEITQIYRELRRNLSRKKTEWEKAMEELKNAMENSAGLYPVIKTLEDGSKVYYMCDHKTLEESEVVFELNAGGWAVSTDGGKTWNAGLMVDGTMITKILNTIGLNADWINTGALDVKNVDGNVLFRADIDTGEVYIDATTLKVTGKTVEEIAQENAKKYVDDVVIDIEKDLNTQYFGEYDPTLSNLPASEWTDTETKDKHLNDIFYNTETRKMFLFTKNETSYQWENFVDPDIQNALDDAANAQDTADGKRRIFVTTPLPPYDPGDMWVTSLEDNKGKIKVCKTGRESGAFVSSDWVFPGYVDGDAVDSAIKAYDTSLGQTEVFNKLTNGGQTQGIYIQDGKLYINADYILSGTLAGKRINAKGIVVYDKNNNKTFEIDENGNVNITPLTFSLTNGDTIQGIANGAAAGALQDAKNYADGLLEDFDPQTYTQQELFNILTNNGQTQGVYLYGGKIYINASYINTGYLAGWEVQQGKLYSETQTGPRSEMELDATNGRIYASDFVGLYNPYGEDRDGTEIKGMKISTGIIDAVGALIGDLTVNGNVKAATINCPAFDSSVTFNYAASFKNTCGFNGTANMNKETNLNSTTKAKGQLYTYDDVYMENAYGNIRWQLDPDTDNGTIFDHTILRRSRDTYLEAAYTQSTSSGSNLRILGGGILYRYASSSKRYKNHVKEMETNDVRKLYEIPVVWFKYKDGILIKNDQRNGKPIPGFYAEDIEKYFPAAADYETDKDGKQILETWNERILIPAMMKMIQDQEKEINTLKEQVGELMKGVKD